MREKNSGSGLLVRVAVETIRQDEKSWRPEANENAETFRMSLKIGSGAAGEKPDGD